MHAQDPAYAVSVLSQYVDAKRAKGATRADISQKLHLLERRVSAQPATTPNHFLSIAHTLTHADATIRSLLTRCAP